MRNIKFQLASRSYSILVKDRLLSKNLLRDLPIERHQRVFVIADRRLGNIERLVLRMLKGSLAGKVRLPGGETTKSLKSLNLLYRSAARAKLDRKSVVIAIGGGVIGDLSGFFAATYLRGLQIIHIPTTLVAQVDSAIGGKTGINLPEGKNLVGSFHQPSMVLTDPTVLRTLPPREFRAGLAEVIKYGVIADPLLFTTLESQMGKVLKLDPTLLEWIIERCCKIKARVVSKDEKELTGLRAILNFGHTIGHGIEAAANYRLLHGEAVAIGMVGATHLSETLHGFPSSQATRVINLIQAAGLPTRMGNRLSEAKIIEAMGRDKKALAGTVRFVLASRIGKVKTGIPVTKAQIQACLRRLR